MGCVVNGPGESKAANIGISLPGTGEAPNCPVYIDGEHFTTLRGTYEELADGISQPRRQLRRHAATPQRIAVVQSVRVVPKLVLVPFASFGGERSAASNRWVAMRCG